MPKFIRHLGLLLLLLKIAACSPSSHPPETISQISRIPLMTPMLEKTAGSKVPLATFTLKAETGSSVMQIPVSLSGTKSTPDVFTQMKGKTLIYGVETGDPINSEGKVSVYSSPSETDGAKFFDLLKEDIGIFPDEQIGASSGIAHERLFQGKVKTASLGNLSGTEVVSGVVYHSDLGSWGLFIQSFGSKRSDKDLLAANSIALAKAKLLLTPPVINGGKALSIELLKDIPFVVGDTIAWKYLIRSGNVGVEFPVIGDSMGGDPRVFLS